MTEQKWAIVGSRCLNDWALFEEGIVRCVETWGGHLPSVVVSGGCKGADRMGEKWALENKIVTQIFKPNWKAHGRLAGIVRNADIIDNATHVLAFPSHTGSGTQNSIHRAQKAAKPTIVLWIDAP